MTLLVITSQHSVKDYMAKLTHCTCQHPQVEVVERTSVVVETEWGQEHTLIFIGISEVAHWVDQEHLPTILTERTLIVLGDYSLATDGEKRDVKSFLQRSDISSALWMDQSVDPEVNGPLLDLLLTYQQNKVDGHSIPRISTLQKRVNVALDHSMSELQRVKQIYHKMVPFRHEKLSGVNLYSKYCAGESAGGEFFDIIDHKSEVIIIQTTAKSYLTSITLLTAVEELKAEKVLGDSWAEKLVSRLEGDPSITSDGPPAVDLLILKYCKRTLMLTGHHFGRAELLFSDHPNIGVNQFPVSSAFLSQAECQQQLGRGERVLVSSPGIRDNLGDMVENLYLVEFLKQQFPRRPREALDELFFQLKKELNDEFTAVDATAIILEVDRNAISRV
jgi:hypothetical protein